MYNKGLFQPYHPNEWKQFCIGGMRNLAKELLNWSELGTKYVTQTLVCFYSTFYKLVS